MALNASPIKSLASLTLSEKGLPHIPHIRHGLMQFSGIGKTSSELNHFYKNGFPGEAENNLISLVSFSVDESFGKYNFQISIEQDKLCLLCPKGYKEIARPFKTQLTLYRNTEIELCMKSMHKGELLNFDLQSAIDYKVISSNNLAGNLVSKFLKTDQKKQVPLEEDLFLIYLNRT